jgi:hypothetical protein
MDRARLLSIRLLSKRLVSIRFASSIVAWGVLLLAVTVEARMVSVRAAAATTAPQKPYQPVAVTLPAAPADESFVLFRAELAAVAERRVYGELARLVARGFFWERDFGGGHDSRRSGIDNLAAALRLERADGGGWTALAGFAAETTAASLEARPGVICGPGRPQFDQAEFGLLLDRTRSDAGDWAYPRTNGLDVRAAAKVDATAIEILGRHFVRVLRTERPPGDQDPARSGWVQVATPSGRTGFVPPDSLHSAAPERLCYSKDITGRWRITGYVAGGE